MAKAESRPSAVTMDSEVVRRIRQHARSHMTTEVCGVLIGSYRDDEICVDECIPGVNAAQAGTRVTFTQETWEHVYQIKDQEFPDSRIIGWYHSHPGFGVFLSDHDTFIHKNFFSSADQVAWVYDPHSDEEGCFAWASDDRIERVSTIRMSDKRGGEPAEAGETQEPAFVSAVEQQDRSGDISTEYQRTAPWMRWTITVISHLSALLLGLLIAWYVFPRVAFVAVPVDPQTGRPLVQAPFVSGTNRDQEPQPVTQGSPNSRKGDDAQRKR
jgi:proteasome lid subunit RPN8/RPN11